MVKQIFSTSAGIMNPLFQQHCLQGRVHVRDYAFYMRKLGFIQQQKNIIEKREENRANQNG